MRSIFALAALLLTVPVAAHADTIQLTLLFKGGFVEQITLPNKPTYRFEGGPQGARFAGFAYSGLPNYIGLNFYSTGSGAAISQIDHLNFGHITFDFQDQSAFNGGTPAYFADLLYDGPTLYTGSQIHPTFIPGTYALVIDSYTNHIYNFPPVSDPSLVTLIITRSISTSSSTPEPSSIVLLTTGILAAAGMARRKLLAA